MAIFRRHDPHHLVPLHPDNVRSVDWVILLEANTIVDGSGRTLRVARAMRAQKVIKTFWPFTRRFFLYVEGYNSRIHFVVFCPQLYKHDEDGQVVPMLVQEI